MCGITGSLNWDEPDNLRTIQAMTKALSHRGPDAENIVALGPLILGHRRLSIIDTVPRSNQPLQDHSQRYWIVLNGEIYNYKTLRTQLKALGHTFVTESDTEVILEAWKRWNKACVEQLVGMFAFALWDTETGCLFLARDRLGEKPLYYQITASASKPNHYNIVFASELTALRKHPSISQEINPKALSQFLSLNYILSDSVILKGVEKLPAAHFLYLQPGKTPQLHTYWHLKNYFLQKTPLHSKKEAALSLRDLLDNSVEQQLVSDVPLGAFLSGGIDSSSLVAAMAFKNTPQRTETFSIGFQEKTYNELNESAISAKHLGVKHHTQVVNPDMATLLPNILQKFDEPFADSSLIPTYFLAQFARQQVTVCLSGDGGDELFAGYETYTADKLYHWINRLPKSFLQLLSHSLEKWLPVTHHKVSFDYKLKQFLKGSLLDFRRAHYYWRTIFSEPDKKAIIHPDYQEAILRQDPFQEFNRFFEEVASCHPLDQASYVDMKTWLVDDILVKVDRASMAHSLETRAPFLDHRLVEFAASLPVDLKMKGFQKKYILKQSQQSRLPKNILYRTKKGFNAPISHWLSGQLRPLSESVTLDSSLSEWFQKSAIEKLWKEHLTLKKDHGLKLFGLTCFGLWLHSFKT